MSNNSSMSDTPRARWDRQYRKTIQSGVTHWTDRWTYVFIEPLRAADAKRILDMGCGYGNEVCTLSKEGFEVTGLDISEASISHAQSQTQSANFIVGDMAEKLPFRDDCFDAIMSNVAAHMFSDSITRVLFSEVKRMLRPDGLFLFHLNSTEDRPLRAKWSPPVREIELNYILEKGGGTMHFFSRAYLLELLSDWHPVNLEHIEILKHEEKGKYNHFVIEDYQGNKYNPLSLLEKGFIPAKRVWRGIIRS